MATSSKVPLGAEEQWQRATRRLAKVIRWSAVTIAGFGVALAALVVVLFTHSPWALTGSAVGLALALVGAVGATATAFRS